MVEGDEKLLFISDIDGETDQHIERLVESAGRCSTPSSSTWTTLRPRPWLMTVEKVIKWLKHHVREPAYTYFAYEDASVQDIKECARAAGFTGNTSQGTLLTYMSIKSRVQGLCLEAGREVDSRRTPMKRIDSVGTLHFSHWVLFPRKPPGLLHDLRR